jgi:hypothetical protein
VANERGGLRVMNHDDIFGKLDALAILLVVHQKNVASVLREFVIAALKRIVERFRDLEEVAPSRDDVPVGRYFQFIEQGNQSIEHLGDSSAHSGGVHHLHRLALQFSGKKLQFIDVCRPNNVLIVIQT